MITQLPVDELLRQMQSTDLKRKETNERCRDYDLLAKYQGFEAQAHLLGVQLGERKVYKKLPNGIRSVPAVKYMPEHAFLAYAGIYAPLPAQEQILEARYPGNALMQDIAWALEQDQMTQCAVKVIYRPRGPKIVYVRNRQGELYATVPECFRIALADLAHMWYDELESDRWNDGF